MITLYGHEISGNTYKVRLLLALLHLDYEYRQVDLKQGEHKQPEYLTINPFGQVPSLTDDELALQDAQAILVYLARQYGGEAWLPSDAASLSRVVRWLSIAAGEVRQGPENARQYHLLGVKSINIERATEKAHQILELLDQHLGTRSWIECDRPTIADIAVFPYVALAPDGNVPLDDYPNILAWIERMKHLPGFTSMRGIEVSMA